MDRDENAWSNGGLRPPEIDRLPRQQCVEINEKSARRCVRALATLSAPTAFAVRKAREAMIAIHVRDEDGFVTVD